MASQLTPAEALHGLLPSDVGVLDARQASDALRSVKAIRGFVDAYEARLTAHIKRLHQAGESAPAADLHTRDGGVSSKEAQDKERRATALESAPSLADKLAAGEITAGHADAIANATCRLDDETRAEFYEHEAALANDATRMTPEEFAKNCRDLIRDIERDHGVDRDRQQRKETRLGKKIDRDGMYVINARLHPELGTTVFRALDLETARLVKHGGDRSVDRAQLAAEALGNLVAGGHQQIRPREAEIVLITDASTLVDGPHADTVCEYSDGTPVPHPTMQRLVCNGRIVPIIVDANGVVLNAGRAQRLANRAQRRALRAMYRTCAIPGCDVPFEQCEIHHVQPFETGGLTDLADLLPACTRHHHTIHEDGWTLELDDARTLTIRLADGTVFAVAPLRRPRTTTGRPVHGATAVEPDRSGAAPTAGGHLRAGRPPDRPPGRPPDQLSLIA